MYIKPEIRKSVCDICDNNCSVDLWMKGEEIIRVTGSPEGANKGRLCAKGYFNREYLYRSDRIQTPLIRVGERGEGKFEAISWDEALDIIVDRLQQVKAEFGPESVLFYTGHAKWYRTIFHRFAHSFGSLNYGSESSSCFHANRMANMLTGGSMTTADFKNTDLYITWGYNPYYTGVYDPTIIEDLREKGMKLLVVDPRVTAFSQQADLHLQIRPGTDGALALFLGRYLIEHDAIDWDFVNNHVHGYDEYASYVADFDAQRVSKITGISEQDLEAAGRLLLENKRFAVRVGPCPLTHARNGIQNMRAIFTLAAISGNYDKQGGIVPTQFTNPREAQSCVVADEQFIQETRPITSKPRMGAQSFPVWDELIDECQTMCLAQQVMSGEPYPIKAIFALGMNAKMFPNDKAIFEALDHVGFFVDVDIFMNDTAKYADIVLPACTSFERDQFQSGFMGDHAFTPNVRFVRRAIKPLFQSRSDIDILCELARRLDLDDPLLKGGYEKCAKSMILMTGCVFTDLLVSGNSTVVPGKDPYYPGDNTKFGYDTPTGKFEICSEVLRKYGFNPLPEFAELPDDERFPYQLVAGGRLPYHYHSRFQTSNLKRVFRDKSAADINAATAKEQGIKQGDEMIVETAAGQIRLKANLTKTVPVGTVWVYQDYPDADVNSIIGNEVRDPISGYPAYNEVRCKVRRAER